MTTHFRALLATFGCLLAASLAPADELKLAQPNRLYHPFNGQGTGTTAATAATPFGPASVAGTGSAPAGQSLATAGSDAGVGFSAGSSRVKQFGAGVTLPTTDALLYPANSPTIAVEKITLRSSQFGGGFASGVPRYLFGDEILPPTTRKDLVTSVATNFWRQKPVQPGESFVTAGGTVTPIATSTVNVTSSSTTSRTVTVASVASGLGVGATLLGEPIIDITGTTVTLADNANQTINGSVACTITPAVNYYYSPHAEKSFASQPGQVTIKWVSALAVSGNNYEVMEETFLVASAASKPIHRIYWNQGGYDGPLVRIADARIQTANPVFNTSVPKSVLNEIVQPGQTASNPEVTSTMSFSRQGGMNVLKAYNVEGRLLVEYLGDARIGNDVYTHVGLDIVELVQTPDDNRTTAYLGQSMLPHDEDGTLTGSPVGSARNFYAAVVSPAGTTNYYAERTTSGPREPDDGTAASDTAYNDVALYWLETGDYGIKWPKYKDRYWLRWSPNFSDYTFQTVDASGSTAATGLSFPSGALPSLVFQDDPAGAEASIDATAQSLLVVPGTDQRNRALLKFTSAETAWYVALYTQAEDRAKSLSSVSLSTADGVTTATVSSTAGLEVGMVATSSSGTGVIARILDSTRYTLRDYVPESPVIANPSFEQNAAGGNNGYLTGTTGISGWTYEGTSRYGLNNASGPFADNGTIPNGTNIAFIQNLLNAGGGLRTTITGLVAGNTYTVSMGVNSRTVVNNSQLKITAGTASTVPETITAGSYQTKTLAFTATATTASLFIENTRIDSDNSLLVDNLSISRTSATDSLVTYTVESDQAARIDVTTVATVGTRLEPPAGHEVGGYISSGTCYYPAAYRNPFVVGTEAANLGAIIPVNAKPTSKTLTVRWFKKVSAPSKAYNDFYVAGKIGRYTVSYPTNPTQIVLAQGTGSGDLLGDEAATGSVYYENNSAATGYNPNEEHAFLFAGRVYALREDLNIFPTGSNYVASNYTSEPYVLVGYTNSTDQRPAMHAYKVLRENDTYKFSYTATAGTLLVKPYPLPLLPLAMVGDGDARTAKDLEIVGADAPANTATQSDAAYKGFTFKDRKGFTWIHRGPHDVASQTKSCTPNGTTTVTLASTTGLAAGMAVTGTGITGTATIVSITNATTLVLSQTVATGSARDWTFVPAFTMKCYYLSQDGFFLPGATTQPAANTILPFLRDASRSGTTLNLSSIENGSSDQPLALIYKPAWPTAAPELAIGETLALPKHGLPQVRGQASAQVFYQQSIAKDTANSLTAKASVTLFDPTREKTYALSDTGLAAIPGSITTNSYQGKTYFQTLSPSLVQRFYLDPLRGTKGTLVLKGVFHDEVAGDDYFDLNVLSAAEVTSLKDLVPASDADKSPWNAAIDGLMTKVETFAENSSKLGTYIVAGSSNVGTSTLATVSSPDTAVDSYALTALGKGAGYVTLVFGNGNAFTPEGDPVQVQVIKVASRLYTGDLKVIQSSNPLDEQTTLRHSADFAANPADYEFDWRYTSGWPSRPPVYRSYLTTKLGTGATWQVYADPGAALPTANQYGTLASGRTVTLPYTLNLRPAAKSVNTLTPTSIGATTTTGSAPDIVSATEVNLSSTATIEPGMVVTGDSLSGSATVLKVVSGTQFSLSQAPTSTAQLKFVTSTYSDEEAAAGFPGAVLKSTAGVDFTAGVPAKIIFSASVGGNDGFVLYVNGVAALACNVAKPPIALTNAGTGLSANGLTQQFNVDSSYFNQSINTIEVALYTTNDPNGFSSVNFNLEAAVETDLVTSGPDWLLPGDYNSTTGVDTINNNTAIIGGSVTNPFGGPQFVLNDRWFTLRYRPKASANNVLGTPWSRWMPAQFNEGWIKRVLAGINPFSQRVKDLYNNAVNTDVSMLTQAGKRWEGNIALTLDNVNSVGLIETYETVLNRAKSMSIDANTNDPDTNNALLLAAGYLNDLYMIVGNEAYADAANPTISLDDGSVNTSRFSFEGQVASSLDEELALLRGRNNSVSPGVQTAPAYNRLYWNYTGGINSGESLYATNYNIKEKSGQGTANGVLDEGDAQLMFPQGHGDAYGHYLTALTNYYRLLHNPNFTWTPRAEAVTVFGQPITIDYQDERKFAAAAAALSKSAQQMCELLYRKNYRDDATSGWSQFSDSNEAWALDETASRSAQGNLFHWAMTNAILPVDDATHTGVQKIDRTTVPELGELEALALSLQTTMDNADAHLNPLGLSPGAIAFDISPDQIKAGTSHYEQVYGRALTALNNASGAFQQAGKMSASLRTQQNTLDDYNTSIVSQESAYQTQLIEIYGQPYSGDIGAGRIYAQEYYGPDLINWFVVDRPFANLQKDQQGMEATMLSQSVDMKVTTPTAIDDFTGMSVQDILKESNSKRHVKTQEVTIDPNQFIQYSDSYRTGGMGTRAETGELQSALMEAHIAYLNLKDATDAISDVNRDFQREALLVVETIDNHANQVEYRKDKEAIIKTRLGVVAAAETIAEYSTMWSESIAAAAEAVKEAVPGVQGVAVDALAPVRGTVKTVALVDEVTLNNLSFANNIIARSVGVTIEKNAMDLERDIIAKEYSLEAVQLAYEVEQKYREMTGMLSSINLAGASYQQANERVRAVIAKGLRVLTERETFRKRAAAVIQGYRTKDLTFRVFRDESLAQYRSLFDLASRYSYLSAKSYDYETGLLGSSAGQGIFDKIVASRSLGDLSGGTPQATTSALGDPGLAGTLAQLNADFSVAKGRLGINNPDQYGTVFSLRSELFRLTSDPANTADNDAWQQTLEQHIVANVAADSDVARYCRNIAKPDGTAVPGLIIPFSSTIQHALNFFGLDYAAGDHNYTPSNFATKIFSVGIALPGYVGMDSFASGGGAPVTSSTNSLGATPYVYLIPCGNDSMLAPPLGDTNTVRTWTVQDQALPLPFNLGATAFNSTQFFDANGTLTEQPWILRKHQAFRPVADATMFYSSVPQEFTNTRLIGRSVWNSRWKIVIPAYTLLKDEQTGLNRFAASVRDIQLFLRTYSHSGN